jgi:hypothetical protein
VGIEHDNGIDAQLAAALADFFMPVDGAWRQPWFFPAAQRYIDGT